jgi:hypothetical protein
MVAAAENPMPDSARFFLAYEGMFSVVMAWPSRPAVAAGFGTVLP